MKFVFVFLSMLILGSFPLAAQNSFPYSHRPESSNFIPSKSESNVSFEKSQDEEFEGFESFLFAPNCWTTIDADGDGNGWFQYGAEGSAYAGNYSAASASWNTTALNPDNYLISPQLTLGENEVLIYHVAAQDPYFFAEKYGVFISTTGNDEADFTTELFMEVMESEVWEERTIDLSAYSGMDVYIAFRHFDVSDQFLLKIDNVFLPGTYTNCSPVCISPSNLSSTAITPSSASVFWDPVGSDYDLIYGISGFDPEAVIPISVDTSFYIIQDLEATTVYDFYVRNNCTEDSLLSEWEMASFITANANEGQGFESFLFLPLCWTSIDADGDGSSWVHSEIDPYAGIFTAESYSWSPETGALSPDNYLISPQLSIGENETLRYYIASQDEYFYEENYGVYVSTSGNDEADFTDQLLVETLGGNQWEERELDFSAYSGMNVFIAFRHFNVTNESQLKLDNVVLPGNVINCITEVKELEAKLFSIYPNPSSGIFYISTNAKSGQYFIEVFDSSGKRVFSKEQLLNTEQEIMLDCGFLQQGIYLVKLSSTQTSFAKRIIVN